MASVHYSSCSDTAAQRTVVELARDLIRFETINPPGAERACIEYLQGVLGSAGLETATHGKSRERPNLIARLHGRGEAPPFLMFGHVDVVPTEGQAWTRPPFQGEILDGVLWGRGALDMKGGLAMMVDALLQAKTREINPAGDVLFVALSDEECGGAFGAEYVVENHRSIFEDVRYAIGEFGGFSLETSGRRFYPIGVSEKHWCTLRVTLRGPGGHGSVPVRDGAMARLAELLRSIDERRLPVHVTPVTRKMLVELASHLPLAQRLALRGMLRPRLAAHILDRGGEEVSTFEPFLRNTVSPTRLAQSAERADAIPDAVYVELDGRILPGFSPQDLIAELRELCDGDQEIEITDVWETGPERPDMGLFDLLRDSIRDLDPAGIPVAAIIPGISDARHFARLGIQTYGFLPMKLAPDFDLGAMIHGPDERIPVDALEFGAEVIYRLLGRL